MTGDVLAGGAMSCEHTRAVLCGESPWIDVSAHVSSCNGCRAIAASLTALDARAAALPPPPTPPALIEATLAAMDAAIDPLAPKETAALLDELTLLPTPPALIETTLAAMDAELRRGQVVPLRRRWWGAAGLVAAAATALVLVSPSEQPADPLRLVAKGDGDSLPELVLKVAVDDGHSVQRLRVGQRYAQGDVLYFRAGLDSAAALTLVRIDSEGAEVIHQQHLPAGEADLSSAAAPLAWELEPGEQDAIFALLASRTPLETSAAEEALAAGWSQPSPCLAAHALGARCQSVFIGVDP